MKERKSFKEYAQCWRELATQVEPLLSEKELTGMFMDTLQAPFFEKMIGRGVFGCPNLVAIKENRAKVEGCQDSWCYLGIQ